MTEAILNFQVPEAKRNYIAHLLEQSTREYQHSKPERQILATVEPPNESDFTLLEEIELLTVNIRGYASQIQARGRIEPAIAAIDRLQHQSIFEHSAIAHFYFTTSDRYPQTKAYLQTIDYLRLVILDYLKTN
ncbi:hypothetical protein ACQ4M3_19970 [Leptolyngbya sp. AN03gr2]|uniref:hypothetical protein n=1 Tax=unclassified Leptolyngbya TaxID=2650499 RepID=UPI003D320694